VLNRSAKLVGGTLAGKGDEKRVCPDSVSRMVPSGRVARCLGSPRPKDPNRPDLSSSEGKKVLPIRVTIAQRESTKEESPLTPPLRDFIDRAILPILVKEYLAVSEVENDLADDAPGAAHSVSRTSAPRPRKVKP